MVRNRIKRRVREAVRVRLERLGSGWRIVINPRSRARTAAFADLERALDQLFQRCGN